MLAYFPEFTIRLVVRMSEHCQRQGLRQILLAMLANRLLVPAWDPLLALQTELGMKGHDHCKRQSLAAEPEKQTKTDAHSDRIRVYHAESELTLLMAHVF